MKLRKYNVVDETTGRFKRFVLNHGFWVFLGAVLLLAAIYEVSDLVAARRADDLGGLTDALVASSLPPETTLSEGPILEGTAPEGFGEESTPSLVEPPQYSPSAPASPDPGEIRVADWNIRWFPSGRPEPQDEVTELITLRMAAKVIRGLEPDILCAEEIRSEDVARQLAKAVKLPDFHLAVCSAYTNYDGTAGTQQTAVFSSFPVLKTKSDSWHTVGYIDPPRGYAFALLDAPGGPVGVFAVHLKSNYVSPDAENPGKLATINRLKRQFASDQVRELVDEWRASGFVPADTRFIVAGDFNTAEHDKRWKGETTLSDFRKAGWRSCYEGLRPEDCYTLPADPVYGYDAVTFDYIFTQGFAGQRALQIHPVPGRISDHAVVTVLLR